MRDLCDGNATIPAQEILQMGSMYLEKLAYYNRTVPLISRAGDQVAQAVQLFLTSLAVLEFLPQEEGLSAVDIGSGGGFPALPLKIARPDVRWELIESRRRKCTVLKALIMHLRLSDITVINHRLEDYVPEAESKIKIVTSRAGPPPVLILKWAQKLPGLQRVLVFESSAKRDLSQFDELESGSYLLRKKEIGSAHGIDSLWLLSFEKRM
jgi:16S rRNA (guanine527-N7)-methyltransferase